MSKPETITIDDVKYVRADAVDKAAASIDGMPYKIIRTQSAGVFAGYVASRNGKEAVINNARRLWYWSGAASLSQLANDGTSKPNDCKFPAPVSEIELTEVIELLTVTEKAKKSIDSVKVWAQ